MVTASKKLFLYPIFTFCLHTCCSGGDRDRDVWSSESGDGTGMFSDWHRQMHEQMEEMDRQMREVFRIFHIPDMPSGMNTTQYTVSDWAKFAVQISKDETPMPLLTVELLFISRHLLCVHLTNLKIHSISQTSPNFEQRTSLEVVNNTGNEATSLTRILFLFA